VDSILKSNLIPSFKKLDFLRSKSEDEFRDRVVRPFYISKRLEPGEDLSGGIGSRSGSRSNEV
jgi:hypothetical protein